MVEVGKNFIITLRLFSLLLWIFPLTVSAIYPENIGATQYGTGHLAAAAKLRNDAVKIGLELGWSATQTTTLYQHVEDFLLLGKGEISASMRGNKISPADRKNFLEMVSRLQEKVSQKSPLLFMIGKDRAVATDGHHKIRSLVKLNEIMEEANFLWPQETRMALRPLGRITPEDGAITRVQFKNPDIIAQLPADAKAPKIMRAILENKMGLWADPEDDKMAKKYYGKKASKGASKKELRYLAARLGIEDGAKGIKFTPVADLPDSPNRTLMGMYFESRGLKHADVSYRTYVEFYVGDKVKEIAVKSPELYPSLSRFLDSSTPLVEQRQIMETAMDELDQMFAHRKELSRITLKMASEGSSELESILTRIRSATCARAFNQLQGTP